MKQSVESMPDNDKVDKKIKGYCHGCGDKVNELTCICSPCVQKGITHKNLELKMCK